jgi:hypothetical protein
MPIFTVTGPLGLVEAAGVGDGATLCDGAGDETAAAADEAPVEGDAAAVAAPPCPWLSASATMATTSTTAAIAPAMTPRDRRRRGGTAAGGVGA